MLLEDLVVALEEQYRLVEEAEGGDRFLARLWHYVCRLRRDPRTRAVLDELAAEARMVDDARRASYVRHTIQAKELLDRLEKECPDLFAGPEPEEGLARETSHFRLRRLAEQAAVTEQRVDDLSAKQAISIARTYLERAASERVPPDSPFFDEVQDLERAEQLARRTWRVARTTAASLYGDMMRLLSPLDPERAPRERPYDLIDELAPNVVIVTAWADEDASAISRLSHKEHERHETVEILRNAVRLVHAEVRARLGDIRSKLALFRRFKTRCEWYDRVRLLEAADEAKGAAENRLTEELALFLFDQGLNPLIRPRVSNQEPDLLDPSPEGRIYVESKQYDDSEGTRAEIRKGARQIWELLAKLRGTRYEVHEAFFPVFRRGGPTYQLPERLSFGGFVVYPLLINIAPSSESGSRSRESAILIAEEELLPVEGKVEPESGPTTTPKAEEVGSQAG